MFALAFKPETHGFSSCCIADYIKAGEWSLTYIKGGWFFYKNQNVEWWIMNVELKKCFETKVPRHRGTEI